MLKDFCFLSIRDGGLISKQDLLAFRKFYASTFALELLVVTVLYALIFRTIVKGRRWRRSALAAQHVNAASHTSSDAESDHGRHSGSQLKPVETSARMDGDHVANIKSAAMLFVVTVVFVITYLPPWLVGLGVIHDTWFVFYMYYISNVCNPVIYGFMNKSFRDDLYLLTKNC